MDDNLKKFVNVWNIASIILLMTSFIAFGAWIYGIIDAVRMAIVMIGITVMQVTILIIRILSIKRKIDRGDYSWIESGVIIPRSRLTNMSVKVGEDILPKGVTPTNVNPFKKCVFRLIIEIDDFPEETLMSVNRTYRSKTDTIAFNKGKNLVKGREYTFDMLSISGEILNFRFSQSGTIKKFLLEELYIP